MRTLLLVTFSLVALAFGLVSYFGVIAFFSWSMFAFPTLLLIVSITAIVLAARRLLRPGMRSRWTSLPLIAVPLACVALFPVSGWLNRRGIEARFRANEQELIAACEAFLLEVPSNTYSWRPEFDLWPSFIGPTRRGAVHHGERVVFISFLGSPGNDAGVAYNPEHVSIAGNTKPLFGPWYRFR